MAAHTATMRISVRTKTIYTNACIRHFRTLYGKLQADLLVNHNVVFDPDCKKEMEEKKLKAKAHPGIMKVPVCSIPEQLEKSINILVQKYPSRDLVKNSAQLYNYLWARHRPVEDVAIKLNSKRIEAKLKQKYQVNWAELTNAEQQEYTNKIEQKVLTTLKKETYHWKPVSYNAQKAFQYLVGRVGYDYGTLKRIFSEIYKRAPSYSPETMFDFGSGVGTATWAANAVWPDSISEHFCVDVSEDMNTISRLLLQGGEEDQNMYFKGVYYRQFPPASNKVKYDLVVSAFSLLEMPNQNERLNLLLSLWRKTKDFMVIVENGTNAGYHTVLESRDFLLQLASNTSMKDLTDREDLVGHVFAPCPHEKSCPRFSRHDGTPCNFDTDYKPLEMAQDKKHAKKHAKFSYMILRKGPRAEGTPWPRIVKPTSNPSKRVHCRTCTAAGNLEYAVLTAKKHGRDLYRCARESTTGDLLPAIPSETPLEDEVVGDDEAQKSSGKKVTIYD